MISAYARHAAVWFALIALAAMPAAAAPDATPDPGAVSAVRHYIDALKTPDTATAFTLLTKAQQRYFGNARNFGSNLTSTGYRIVSYTITKTTERDPKLVEVDVAQTIDYFDVASQQEVTGTDTEPYFALRDGDAWGVKELVTPWKSYAPRTSGASGGFTVVVDRVEFFDRRIQVDCTLRDLGAQPFQALPLLKSTLAINGTAYKALDTSNFLLDDRDFFQGVRIYPDHQQVGFINFPVPSHLDAPMTATLTIGPVIEDGASGPTMVTVGPIPLPKL